MRGPPKVKDPRAIFGIFDIKKMRGSPKIVDLCAILVILNIKKMY